MGYEEEAANLISDAIKDISHDIDTNDITHTL